MLWNKLLCLTQQWHVSPNLLNELSGFTFDFLQIMFDINFCCLPCFQYMYFILWLSSLKLFLKQMWKTVFVSFWEFLNLCRGKCFTFSPWSITPTMKLRDWLVSWLLLDKFQIVSIFFVKHHVRECL